MVRIGEEFGRVCLLDGAKLLYRKCEKHAKISSTSSARAKIAALLVSF